jgi:hypothetical protein
MPQREIKLFPTPKNYFNNGSAPQPWPVSRLIAFLQDQQKKVPEAERESLVAEGCDGITLKHQTTITPEQLDQEKLQLLLKALAGASRDGLTRDEVEALLRRVALLS